MEPCDLSQNLVCYYPETDLAFHGSISVRSSTHTFPKLVTQQPSPKVTGSCWNQLVFLDPHSIKESPPKDSSLIRSVPLQSVGYTV
ncbi:hypothetical protein Ciccas_003513 [Cichlidogyrus casuarinus]|uniref:Leptin receptor n=1 Tax=Cichlidogyrus casuarinus TaxID=1844966 RepID=A0ABD2QE49_9PLAT